MLEPAGAAAPRAYLRSDAPCYVGTLLDVVTPLDLNFELPSAASLLNASSANSTAAAGLNATAIAFEGLRQTQVLLGVSSQIVADFSVGGVVPALNLTVEE